MQTFDQELFELCKEVYERKPEWDDLPDDNEWITERGVLGYKREGIAPLYTSHYLLEKLEEKHYQLRLEHNHSDMNWYAYFAGKNLRYLFDKDDDWDMGADTPLKALLKLAIALHEAGEFND